MTRRPRERRRHHGTTTTIFDGRVAATPWRTCHSAGGPQMGCSTFGVADLRRLPSPAASTTAVSVRDFFVVSANRASRGRGARTSILPDGREPDKPAEGGRSLAQRSGGGLGRL